MTASAQPYIRIQPNEDLPTELIAEFLTEPTASLLSENIAPIYPQGGDVFVWRIDGDELLWTKTLRCDGYPWRSEGTRQIKNTQITKHYRKLRNVKGESDARFARTEFVIVTDMKYCVFHYQGDHTVHTPRPHGNCKRTHPFVRHPYVRSIMRNKPPNSKLNILRANGNTGVRMQYNKVQSQSDASQASSLPALNGNYELSQAPLSVAAHSSVPPTAMTSAMSERLQMKQFRVLELEEEYLRLKIEHKKLQIEQIHAERMHPNEQEQREGMPVPVGRLHEHACEYLHYEPEPGSVGTVRVGSARSPAEYIVPHEPITSDQHHAQHHNSTNHTSAPTPTQHSYYFSNSVEPPSCIMEND